MPVRQGETGSGTVSVRWDRDVRGSADRYVMRAYAYAVTVALTGGTCPLTGLPFSPEDGEVDRAVPGDGYAPGNVVLVSRAGNQGRAALQSSGDDVPGAARYADDVTRVSRTVPMPRPADAKATVSAWSARDDRAAVLAGPYG